MTLFLIKCFLYAALLVLAYACIQTANSMSKGSGKCAKVSLIAMIVGCAAMVACAYYNLTAKWMMLASTPVILGASLWLIIESPEMHRKLDNLFGFVKNIANRAR